MFSKIKKKLLEKKGDIALIGIVITITVTIFIQGYLDTTSANFIIDEAQSMIDLTTMTTLQSSVDTEGLSYERMTIRPYNYDYEYMHKTQNVSGLLYGDANSSDPIIKELGMYSIWLDGRNAYYIENHQAPIDTRLEDNFKYYLKNFLVKQLEADGITIESYQLTNFTGTLIYDNWGINRKYHRSTTTYELQDNASKTHTTNEYIYMPQATIDATIQLEVDIDPTFTTAFYSYALYNAQTESDNRVSSGLDGTYIIDSGFNDEGNLILTVRVLGRQTFY